MDVEKKCAKLREHGLFGQAEYLKWHESMRRRYERPGVRFRTCRTRNEDGTMRWWIPFECLPDEEKWKKAIHSGRKAKVENLKRGI